MKAFLSTHGERPLIVKGDLLGPWYSVADAAAVAKGEAERILRETEPSLICQNCGATTSDYDDWSTDEAGERVCALCLSDAVWMTMEGLNRPESEALAEALARFMEGR